MNLKIAQVIGLNTDQKAAQVISESLGEESRFFAVLVLSSDDAFTRGRQFLSEISSFYIDLNEGSEGQKLNASFEQATKSLENTDFSLLLGVISGKALYLISKGEIQVYLKRGDKLSPLSIGAQGQLVSGFLQEKDRVLFITQSLVSFLADDLTKALELNIDSFEDAIADMIGNPNVESQGLAALLVDVQASQEEISGEQSQPVLQVEENIPSLDREQENISYTAFDSNRKPLNAAKMLSKKALSFIWSRRKNMPQSKRGRLILAGILILVLGVGVWFNIQSKKDAKVQTDFNQAINEAKDAFNSAKGLASLNSSEAKLNLDRATEKVNIALNLKPKDSEAQELKNQIEQESPTLLQQFSVSEFPLFLDLDLIKKNFRPGQMSVSNGKILLLDSSLETLVAVDLEKKSNQVLGGSEQLGDAETASINGDLAFIYSKDKGILKVDTKSLKFSTVTKTDKDLGQIKDIYGFAGNVYILDSASNQIWKYLPTAEGYSDKREYLNKTTTADFSNTQRMQIESSVYILKGGGEVLRFTRGDKDHFSFDGLPSPVKDIKSIFTSSEVENLYLLDSGNSRVLIVGKTGGYKSQISGDKFSTASDLVVDEEGKKLYLLEGSKIYEVGLK